jgi:hypothetical protein
MTTEKLTLAEAYYMVAADLERQACQCADVAARLYRTADTLSEDAVREKAKKEQP